MATAAAKVPRARSRHRRTATMKQSARHRKWAAKRQFCGHEVALINVKDAFSHPLC
jgi:hypothetical protein